MQPITPLRSTRPRLQAAVEAVYLTCFAVFTPIGVVRHAAIDLTAVSVSMIALVALATLVSFYRVLCALHGHPVPRRWVMLACFLPALHILAEAGMISSILINGRHSPFGGGLDGTSGPLTNGLVASLPWPIGFSIGIVLGAVLVRWMAKTVLDIQAKVTP
ncbi:MAG: hypothetical protein AAGH42_00920 [Pseudomonadota bacterium]